MTAVSAAMAALAHRRKPPLRSLLQKCPLGVASGAAPTFAFGAWFCRYAPAAPYFAGALFPVRRFRFGLGKPLWCAVRKRPSPGRAEPVPF